MARRRRNSISLRTLHDLAEDIHEALDREGYWDEEPSRSERVAGRRRGRRSTTRGMVRLTARRAYEPRKKKRKVSGYQKEFGRQLKKLKKKHPRTPISKLMKKAHAATRRARRGR